LELKIDKLIYGGDGLARLPADEHGRGKAVFLPFVLEGERVEATLVEERPGFARARVQRVLEPSATRIDPGCPYFARCGGCHYQHTSYEHQLEIKAAILKENLRRIAKLELPCELVVHPSPPWNYRNRTRLRAQTFPEFALGYYQFGSHELLPVEECPISSPLINRAIKTIWELGRDGGLDARVREVEFFANAEDSELLVEVYVEGERGDREEKKQIPRSARNDKLPRNDKAVSRKYQGANTDKEAPAGREENATTTPDPASSSWDGLAESVRASIPNATGVAVFPQAAPACESKMNARSVGSAGAVQLQYKTAHANYRVSAGAFFQVNRFLTDELVEVVSKQRSGRAALDLYAGVGLFSAVLSREFERVIAVESSQQSSADLAYNVPGNVKSVRATVEEYLKKSSARADLVVVDPPRGGLGERVSRSLAELRTPAVTYVSCDPATLARDLVVLLAAGYHVEQAHLVDLFPQTFHLETVLHLTR
jgi:23S rRNA (uracil1939-C5)-methyltransferase